MRSGNRHALIAALLLLLPLLPVHAEDGASVLTLAGLQHEHVAGVHGRFSGLDCDAGRVDDERGASPEIATPIRVAVTCFLNGERTSGMYKICYYDCLGSTVAITVDAIDLCPLTINR